MKNRFVFPSSFFSALGLSLVALFFLMPKANAQRELALSSDDALNWISKEYGDQSVEWLVEMRGFGGIPQPIEWEILAYDQRAPRKLRWFVAGGGRVKDDGIDTAHYPERPPGGYLSRESVRINSEKAFKIVENEARKAKVGFDRVDYFLRVREFSREPIWRLELKDADRMLAGKIYLSAKTGEVLRTIWVFRGGLGSRDARAEIVDSAEPRANEMIERPVGPTPDFSQNERSEPAIPDRIPIPDDRPVEAVKPDRMERPVTGIEPRREVEEKPEPEVRDPRQPADLRKGAESLVPKGAKPENDTRIPPPPIPPSN
ncbi:MAG: hypothetical protein HKN23_00530 [Verrucomicrobiales bacterium]|nr:hypothetical protein [Verrucomicrobiales bacterium]